MAGGGARAAGIHQRNSSEGPMKLEEELRRKEKSLNRYVFLHTYLLMAVTGTGYLALLWSTVVLLGGFVTMLGKKDFWCITAISMIQAAGIFNGWGEGEEGVMANFLMEMSKFFFTYQFENRAVNFVFIPLMPLVLIMLFVMNIIFGVGSFICAGISLWRMIQRDYGSVYGDSTKTNLMPAMDTFYSLVIFQGTLFFLWMTSNLVDSSFAASISGMFEFPEMWGRRPLVAAYLDDSRSKCWRDPRSIKTRRLVKYTVDLLDSDSSQDYLFGSRILDVFIKHGVDVGPDIVPSSQKVQKLIDTLRWRSSDREVRELSARILAHIACDIDLTLFPGAIRCISSLLDTNLPYWNSKQGSSNQSPRSKVDQQGARDSHIDDNEGDRWNELILQGLTILERLASDQHNCRDICSTPGLLPKIMAPIYSDTLIQDIKMMAWQDIVNGTFRLVHRLISVPEWTGSRLAHEISSSKQAVSNLVRILDEGSEADKELQMRAIEILTELTVDSSANLAPQTVESLIKKQIQIFLAEEEEENLKVMAGQTLAVLSQTEFLVETGSVSLLIMSKYIVDHLTEVLDAKNKIIYRTIAAEILENLCTHHTMDREFVKNTLAPKVLAELLNNKREQLPETSGCHRIMPPNPETILTRKVKSHPAESSLRKLSGPGLENQDTNGVSSEGNDEEKQLSEKKRQIKSSDQANKEQTTSTLELQEAFLSLTLVICNKLISADDFDFVAQRITPAPGVGTLVWRLKAIVEENCEATANRLRIVKLCGQISVAVMGCSQYIEHFKDQKFVEALSKASRIMCNLESCMLFAGTDGGAKKTVRPLLSDLVKEAQAMVA